MAVRADAARALLLRWPARRGLAVRANARFVGTRTQSSGSSGSGDPDAAADGDRGTRAAAARPCHNPLCRNALRPPAIPAHMLAHPTDERIWPEPRESPILAHLPMLYHSPPHRVDTAWTGDPRQPRHSPPQEPPGPPGEGVPTPSTGQARRDRQTPKSHHLFALWGRHERVRRACRIHSSSASQGTVPRRLLAFHQRVVLMAVQCDILCHARLLLWLLFARHDRAWHCLRKSQ